VLGWNFTDWGQSLPVDLKLDDARPQDFDALLLPGGVINPDKLRMIPAAVQFVKAFFDAGRPVAAICHGPWMIVEADKARGRRMTSWPSVRTDLRNAGAEVVDEEAVVDGNLVTSRKPDDIPAFSREMIRLFAIARGHRRVAKCPCPLARSHSRERRAALGTSPALQCRRGLQRSSQLSPAPGERGDQARTAGW
jgi:protease I